MPACAPVSPFLGALCADNFGQSKLRACRRRGKRDRGGDRRRRLADMVEVPGQVDAAQGETTIMFGNPTGHAPNIDKITVAPASLPKVPR